MVTTFTKLEPILYQIGSQTKSLFCENWPNQNFILERDSQNLFGTITTKNT